MRFLEIREHIAAFENSWRQVAEAGGVIKDTSTGLVDFYGYVGGRPVWLCWMFGETTIEFYHELDSGFSERRPIGPEAPARLLN